MAAGKTRKKVKDGTGVEVRETPAFMNLMNALEALTRSEVLVGFPQDTTERKAGEGEEDGITNASLAYIHDNGAPEQNIPQRPFMIPGITEGMPRIERRMKAMGRNVLINGKDEEVVKGFHSVGLIAQAAIRNKINEGIPPPLSDRTVRERAAKGRKGAMWEMAWRNAGAPASLELAKPLIDTAQMRNSVSYVVRDRKKRKR